MANVSHSLIKTLLKQARFPDFELDEEGFPDPGTIVRYFREKMKYQDSVNRREKNWTQADLAKRLGVSEVTVRIMKTIMQVSTPFLRDVCYHLS